MDNIQLSKALYLAGIKSKKITLSEGFEMTESEGNSDMKKVIFFSYNFPHDFVERVWADEGNILNHLKSKWDAAYSKEGASGAFNRFYVNLDNENRSKLEDWIKSNYRG